MKKILRFSAIAALVALACSCNKENNENIPNEEGGLFYISATSPSTKTYLGGDKADEIFWTTGDKIKVNNHNSIGLQAEKNFGETAEFGFTAAEQPEAPFYAVYNANRAYGYGEGGAYTYKLSLDYNDYTQKWVENSFDPEYSVLYGSSEEAAGIQFHHAMAYIKVTPELGEVNVNIAKVMIFANGGEMLSGRMYINTTNGELTAYRDTRDYVTMAGPAEGVALGKSFMIAIPAGTYTNGLKFRFVDTNGQMMEKSTKTFTAVAGTVYPISCVYADPVDCPATATACEVSSSTANFTWTLGKGAATDVATAWTIELAKDAAFTQKVVTRDISASNSCWKSIQPKFCFGGLEQGTEYFFRASVTGQDNWSDVVSATTTTFDLTVVTENAQAGDVILAEDFHDSCEGGESLAKAAGFGTKQNALKTYTDAGATMSGASTWAPWADASFGNWGWTRPSGGATFYPNQGHIKLGRAGDNSFAVTPVLSAISGFADIEVEVTAAVYPDATDRAKTKEFFVATLKGEFDANHTIAIKGLDLPGKVVVSMTDNTKWITYKATLYGVAGDDHLVIGSNYDAANTRLLISDVKVTVKSVSSFAATATEASSSTVSFTWGYAAETAEDNANHPYEIYLYKDEACTDLVVSHRFTANNACWKSRKPKFCFGGLEPNTTYYFKAKDTYATVESQVVSATTSAFTIVTMPTTAAAAGDIILAEDFSEVILGGEPVIASAAACVEYNEANVFAPVTGSLPACVYNTDTDEKGLTNATALSGKRLEAWSYAFNSGSSMYAHVGCIKLGTGSNNTWITTPVLSAIPAGKKADLEITVTLSAWSGAVTTGFVYAGNIADKASITAATNVIKSSSVTTVVGAWKTYTITLSGVDNTMRLAIGPDNDTSKTAKGKGRMVVNDVVVKIKSLN